MRGSDVSTVLTILEVEWVLTIVVCVVGGIRGREDEV